MGVPVRVTEQGKPVMEQLAARWVVAFSMVLIGTFSLVRFLPNPAGLPDYARFLPADTSDTVATSPAQVVESESEATAAPAQATPTLPLTGASVTVTVESANCRAKPRSNAEKVTFLYKDQRVEVVGKNDTPGNRWWYIKIPDSGGRCWLWGVAAKLNGSEADIPVVP